MAERKRHQVKFSLVIDALLDNDRPFPPAYLRQFSDLDSDKSDALKKIWGQINVNRKVSILQDLEEISESDTEVSFESIGRIALKDPDPYVRAGGVRALWDCQATDLISQYIKLMKQDEESLVRATAASALGQYVLLGELEEIPTEMLSTIEDSLLETTQSKDLPLVRRRALEAIGYSSRDEVPLLIKMAFATGDKDWLASALFAMGRSADTQWEEQILQSFYHPEVEVQFEAVRAAGELELQSAREPLIKMLENDDQLDENVRSAVITSLSHIGGEGVKDVLMAELEKTENDEEAEFIEESLDYLDFTQDANMLGMFDFDVKDEDELKSSFGLSSADLKDEDEENF